MTGYGQLADYEQGKWAINESLLEYNNVIWKGLLME